MIENLKNISKYPDNPLKIKFVQTHISNVFISKKFVYKIKKPVNFGFLDFTTLKKRKYYCEREIELNSRLSPNIYVKTVPVKKIGAEYFFDSADGETVDYAVVMKKINENYLLKNLLSENKVSDKDIEKIAAKLFEFHSQYPAPAESADKYGGIKALKFTTDENFSQTEKYINITINKEQFENIKNFTDSFYKERSKLFEQRIANNKITETHGDLHIEHVGIDNGEPFFLDCIEFNDRFRITDVANEIAFLIMDLDFNGYENFGKTFFRAYKNFSEDKELDKLILFYKVYRAYVRGKVTSFLIDDANIPDKEKKEIQKKAIKYFELANNYINGGEK